MKSLFWNPHLLGNGTSQDQVNCHIGNYSSRYTSPSCKNWSKIGSFGILRNKEKRKGKKIMECHKTREPQNKDIIIITIMMMMIIVSFTKFSIVIGSPRAYLSRNRREITWLPKYRNCPI